MSIAHVRPDGTTQALLEHLSATGQLCSNFARSLGLPNTGYLVGLLHDIGKESAVFQRYLLSATGMLDQDADGWVDASGLKGKIDHSSAGAQWCWQQPKSTKRTDHICRQILSLCICSHHSGLKDCLSPDGNPYFTQRMQRPEEKTHFAEVLRSLPSDFLEEAQTLLQKVVLAELGTRLCRLADTNKMPQAAIGHPYCTTCTLPQAGQCLIRLPLWHFKTGLLTRALFSCLLDADRIDSANFEHPEQEGIRSSDCPDWTTLSTKLEKHLDSLAEQSGRNLSDGARNVNAIRRMVADSCLRISTSEKGIYTLTAPTGGAKTLSALRFSLNHARHHGMARVIHVIPYTSIIDQNARIAREILEKGARQDSIVLEQHSNLDPERETWQGRVLAENWDAPVVYTTMVQFLESLFGGGTRGARRMHRLTDAVIVFDEIQTLPIKCVHLFCNAVSFLVHECGASVVLCTATQPRLNNLKNPYLGELPLTEDAEIIPDVSGLYSALRRVSLVNQIRPEGWSVADISELAWQECERTGSCLVIVNTKRQAKAVYVACAQRQASAVFHLSTGMCPAHRKKTLDAIRDRLAWNASHPNNQQPIVCISTQLIEAGVDVDFSTVIRSLAGMDSIHQAAGRCNRNGRSVMGYVHLINPRDENLTMLPEILKGQQKTLRVLNDFAEQHDFDGDYLKPEVIERYFHYYFHDQSKEMAYSVSIRETTRTDTLLNMLSCNAQNIGNMPYALMMRQSFEEAGRLFSVIDAPTRGLIVPYGDGTNIIEEISSTFDIRTCTSLMRKAQRYTVNVFPNDWDALLKERPQGIHEIRTGTGIYYLDARYYDAQFGLSITQINEMEDLVF